MKNLILTFLFLCACMITMTGCGSKEIKDIKGEIVDFKTDNDTLISARLLVDNDTIILKMADARLINGMFLSRDSVKVSYIEGRKDTLRALIVSIIPNSPHFLDTEAAKNDPLITSPAK